MTNTVEDIIGHPTGITEINRTPQVHIFPNPATDELTIRMDRDAYNSFTISNTMGQEVMVQQLTGTQTKVNVKALPAGVYYITLRGDNGVGVEKVVKW